MTKLRNKSLFKIKSVDRYWEIDLLRAVAVLAMITYHTLFDLNFLGVAEVNLFSPPLQIMAKLTAVTFFILVGVSLNISYSRSKTHSTTLTLRNKYITRGTKLFLWGMIISIITLILYGSMPILFGVLHFIGVSVILGYFSLETTRSLRSLPRMLTLTAIGLAVLAVTPLVHKIHPPTPLFVWLGLTPTGFQSLDYYPLIPWYGFVHIGIVIGRLLYPQGRRRFTIPDWSNRLIAAIGQNALVIYLVHQPILYFSIVLLVFIQG